jgi:pimeloyl-ACP methyl ester carboxylesterase
MRERPSQSAPGAWLGPARHIKSADGTTLAYYVHGPDDDTLPTAIIANGLGGPPAAWSAIVAQLEGRYRFVTWDYRGLYASSRPKDDVVGSYAVGRQVDDLEAVARATRTERAVVMGWSMGVQVALESARRRPSLVERMVLMNGTYGRPLDTALPIRWSKRVMGPMLDVTERFARPVGRVLRVAGASRATARAMKIVGTLSPSADEDRFLEIASVFGTLDVEVFAKTLKAIGEHDAAPWLGSISAPTLVLAGDRDLVTPERLAREMVSRMPRAQLLVVRGATHYAAVEFPDYVGLSIERFLESGQPDSSVRRAAV